MVLLDSQRAKPLVNQAWGDFIMSLTEVNKPDIPQPQFLTLTFRNTPDLRGVPGTPPWHFAKNATASVVKKMRKWSSGSAVIEKGSNGDRLHAHAVIQSHWKVGQNPSPPKPPDSTNIPSMLRYARTQVLGELWVLKNDWQRAYGFTKSRPIFTMRDDARVSEYISKTHCYMAKDAGTAPVWFWQNGELVDVNLHPTAEENTPHFKLPKSAHKQMFERWLKKPIALKKVEEIAQRNNETVAELLASVNPDQLGLEL